MTCVVRGTGIAIDTLGPVRVRVISRRSRKPSERLSTTRRSSGVEDEVVQQIDTAQASHDEAGDRRSVTTKEERSLFSYPDMSFRRP